MSGLLHALDLPKVELCASMGAAPEGLIPRGGAVCSGRTLEASTFVATGEHF